MKPEYIFISIFAAMVLIFFAMGIIAVGLELYTKYFGAFI